MQMSEPTVAAPIRPHLKWGLIGFAIAAAGVGLGFAAGALSIPFIGVLGFVITAAGVSIGVFAVILGFAKIITITFTGRSNDDTRSGPAA
jgi:hypothetical protein